MSETVVRKRKRADAGQTPAELAAEYDAVQKRLRDAFYERERERALRSETRDQE